MWANLLSASVSRGNPPALAVSTSAKNQISGVSGLDYDAAENMWHEPGRTYTYDAENKMKNAVGVDYFYDGDGKRVKKDQTSGSTYDKLYWYGLSADPMLESDLAGTVTDEYIFFGGKRTARRQSSATIHYYFADHLGSSRVVTSTAGAILEDSDYYPFGGERVVTDTTNNNYKFTGKERDTESGLDFFIARYYSSAYGRFLIPDWAAAPTAVPYADFGNPQSLNLYTYVGNNPITRFDEDGHCWPVSECVTKFQNAVDSATEKVVSLAIKSESSVVAGGTAFAAGMARDLVNGAADAFRAGEAIGACADNCNGTQMADAVGQDLGRGATLVSYAAAGVAGGQAIAVRLQGGSAPTPPTGSNVHGNMPKQGIYEGPDATAPGRTYVGQSGDIPQRLAKQESAGKFPKGTEVKTQEVLGGKTAREIAEQRRINQLGGVRSNPGSRTSNQRNPVGKKRKHLMDDPPGN